MKNIIIIPSRMASTRFKNKPMTELLGMPMIGHCYLRSKMVKNIDEVFVATCDKEIYEYIITIGGQCIMTSMSHTRASTRTAEALEKIEKRDGIKIPIVIMVQGDEPAISPDTISKIVKAFDNKEVQIVNLMSSLNTKEELRDNNNVKVVVNKDSDALYFSREPIPSLWSGDLNIPRYMQTGIIAFRRDALVKFNSIKETILEQVESIDMNRVLESGGSVRMIHTSDKTLGVDVIEDVKIAEAMLAKDSVTKRYLK